MQPVFWYRTDLTCTWFSGSFWTIIPDRAQSHRGRAGGMFYKLRTLWLRGIRKGGTKNDFLNLQRGPRENHASVTAQLSSDADRTGRQLSRTRTRGRAVDESWPNEYCASDGVYKGGGNYAQELSVRTSKMFRLLHCLGFFRCPF